MLGNFWSSHNFTSLYDEVSWGKRQSFALGFGLIVCYLLKYE